MKSITLHKLDPALATELERRARAQRRSLNRTAQELLRSALGLADPRGVDRTDSFRDLFGTWKEADLKEFKERTADLGQVDAADWKG